MSFSKCPIKRFNEEESCAPPPNKYDLKPIGNTKAFAFEKYSGRNDNKTESDEKEFRAPRTPPSERPRKRIVDNSSRKPRATPTSAVIPIPFGNRYVSTEDLNEANNQIRDLREQLKDLETNKTLLATQLQTVQNTLEHKTKCEETLQNEKAEAQKALESTMKSHKEELEKLQETKRVEIANLVKVHEEFTSKLVKEHSQQLTSLKSQLDEARLNVMTLTDQIETLETHVGVERSKVAKLEQKLETQRSTLDTFRNHYETLQDQLEITEQKSIVDNEYLQELQDQMDQLSLEKLPFKEQLHLSQKQVNSDAKQRQCESVKSQMQVESDDAQKSQGTFQTSQTFKHPLSIKLNNNNEN